MELLKDSIRTEPFCNVRGLKCPASIQPGMLEFNPKSVQSTTIGKSCSMMGRSQRLEWGLVNPEKISEFLHWMKVDKIFRSYYHGLYDSLRLIFNTSSVVVIQAEKHWTTKLNHVLEDKQGAQEQCEEEIIARRARVTWLEQIKADELNERNLWRSGLVPLPVWRRMGKKHAAKRKGNKLTTTFGKKRKVDEESLEKSSPGRRVKLIPNSKESENSRNVVCVSDEEWSCSLDSGSGLTLSILELDFIVTAWIQINP